jgi:hypothetical protein
MDVCLMAEAYVLSEYALISWNYLNLLKVLNFKKHIWLTMWKTNYHVAGNVRNCPNLAKFTATSRLQSELSLHNTYWS